ncbi:MAG: hypothetical protein RL846_34250, partial [Deltaproteobacteria bacterium]
MAWSTERARVWGCALLLIGATACVPEGAESDFVVAPHDAGPASARDAGGRDGAVSAADAGSVDGGARDGGIIADAGVRD